MSFPYNFTIPPETDLWLKPAPFDAPQNTAGLITHNQPTFYHSIPLAFFVKATVRVSFTPVQLYDQSGLVITFPEDDNKWIKAGIEYVDGEPKRSSVVTTGGGRAADWSVAPPLAGTTIDADGRVRSTIEFERENATGTSMFIRTGGQLVREVAWMWSDRHEACRNIQVGFYGARPALNDTGDFTVLIEDWSLVTKSPREEPVHC